MNTCDEYDLRYGLKDGQLVFIDEVVRGLDCACLCPHCGGKLIARKGEVNQHHFAHYQVENCGKGVETALHLLAKQVLQEEKCIRLPDGDDLELLTAIEIERRRLGYVSDVGAVFPETGEEIDIEIKVTHGVDKEKLDKVISQHAKMMEIDLSGLFKSGELTKEGIKQAVIFDAPRYWAEELIAEMEELETGDIGKDLVCGYKAVNGYSHKNQSDFEFAALYVLVKQDGRSSPNYQIQGQGGYVQDEIPMKMDEKLLNKLDQLSFPVKAELVIGTSFVKGKLKPVVSDLII
ncbi:MAG: hypothetical protein K6L74_16085 [Neptuniibacter sp.]